MPVGKLLFSLALPTVLAQLINVLYNIVDRMYVGRMEGVGSLALAGLGISFPIIILIAGFSALIGMGGAPRAAISMGKKNNKEAEHILGNSFFFLIILSVLLTVFFELFQKQILLWFGASENTLPFAQDYLHIYLIGTIFVQLSLGLNQFISAQGFAKTSMYTVLIGAIVNIVLDPIFIFGLDMGVKGAALATVISQGLSAVWVVVFLCGKKTTLKIRPANFKLKKKIMLPVLALGMSPFIMQVTECLIQLTFNTGMAKYGGDVYVGVMSILFSTMQVVYLPMQGLSQGAQPIISYNYGANNIPRVKQAFRYVFISSVIFSCVMCALSLIVPQMFIAIFSNDPAMNQVGARGVRIFMAGVFALGVQCSCQSTFVALGQAKISTFLALLRKVILLVPLALILPRIANMGTDGLFLAEPIADILAALTTGLLFLFTSKKIYARGGEGA